MIMNPYTGSLLCASLVSAAVGAYVWKRRKTTQVRAFPLLMVALSWWSLTYGMEVGSTDLNSIWFWVRIEYLGIAASPVLLLLFSVQYSGKGHWLSLPVLAGLFVVPLNTVVLCGTNRLHHLYYRNVTLDLSGPFSLLGLSPGPGYWLHLAYSYTCLVGGILLLLSVWVRSSHIYRRQAGIMLLGAAIPFAANILYIMGVRPFNHLDITPFAFTLTGVIVAFGLFHYRLFDLLPLARGVLLENLKDGIIVVDGEKRIYEINPAAREFLGIQGNPPIGEDVVLALADEPELAALLVPNREAQKEVTLRPMPLLVLDVRYSPLLGRNGRVIGGLMVLRDITADKRAEEELRKSHERLELLLHSLPDAILVIDANTRYVLDVNPQACLLIGLPVDRIIGSVCDSFFPDQKDKRCSMAGEERSVYRSEGVLVNGEGKKIPVLKTVLAIDVEGDEWLIESLSDISEFKRAETERLEKEKLQALVETAGAVCHEMNQPLMALTAYAELCLMDLDKEHPAFEQIQKMLEQAERMAVITLTLTWVTAYKTKDYLKGKILDIDSASMKKTGSKPFQ
jgi:PAS domain S-box-containing protein